MSEVDWARGIFYSVIASIIGGASKLAIRKSWLMVQQQQQQPSNTHQQQESTGGGTNPTAITGSPLDNDMTTTGHEDGYTQNPISNSEIRQRNSKETNTTSSTEVVSSNYNLHQETTSSQSKSEATTERIAIVLRVSGMIGMTFLNPLFCVLAMNYASPSILAPFSGLTLVWIVQFSELLINERPKRIQIFAAFLIVLGEVIVAVWGDHTNDDGTTVEEVEESYKNIYFQLYFLFMTLWMILITYLIVYRPTPTLRRFAWGVSGGSITGFQNFLKDTLTIKKAIDAANAALDDDSDTISYPWYFPLFVIGGICTAFGGLLCLTACMKRYDATFSSAMFVGSFVISASIMSAVHYNTFQNLVSLENYIMYPLGLIVLMIGVGILVKETSDNGGHGNDVEEDEVEVSSGGSRVPDLTRPLVSDLDENEDDDDDDEPQTVV